MISVFIIDVVGICAAGIIISIFSISKIIFTIKAIDLCLCRHIYSIIMLRGSQV